DHDLFEQSYRACRPRGAGARGTFREELGVALVEPGYGVVEMVGGEDLGPPTAPLRVDLVHVDRLHLVGADVERAARETARRQRRAREHERIAERCERLLPGGWVSSPH